MICFLLNDSMRREFCINIQNSRRIESELVVQGDGLEFPRSLNMLGLGKLEILVARDGIHVVAK